MAQSDYTVPATCAVCGKKFMARYNVAGRAKACTPPSHKCRRGKRDGRKVSCLDGCCRSKYYRGLSKSIANSPIDSRKFLNGEEYKKVLLASKKLQNPEGISIRFALETGCRLREVPLVRRRHLEWKDGPLSVVRIPTLKNVGHPELPVHLDNKGEFVRELRAWVKGLKSEDPLFEAAPRTLQETLERILDRVKPDRASLFHILRHTRATRLSTSGLPPNVIRAEMRWSSIELLKVYSHTTEKEVAEGLEKIR